MPSKQTTVKQYLSELHPDRRDTIEAVRAVILKNLPAGYEEGIQYGMIGYYVPHRVYPSGYHCDPRQPLPFAALASQKNYMSLYLMCVYGNPEHEAWFKAAWTKTGKKLDMGKSCVRFKRLEDVPLDVVGAMIKRVPSKKFIAYYEDTIEGVGLRKAAQKSTARKSPAKKVAKKKTVKKTTTVSSAKTKKTTRPTKKTTAKKATRKKR